MTKTLPLDKVPGFGKLLQAYLNNQLGDGYQYDSFNASLVEEKAKQRESFAHREVLVSTLKHQNTSINLTDSTKKNIDLLLQKNTVCITTGHQLALMGGPLFVTYKILTTVKLCNEYKKICPDFNFVPVFWMASEDHDKDEINQFKLFGKSFTWETPQTGAVGTFSNEGIANLLETIEQEINGLDTSLLNVFKAAYALPNLADATRHIVNHLFGTYGIVILDGNDKALKQLLLPVVEKEVTEKIVHATVKQQNQVLEKAGYEARINPRELNLFLLAPNDRKRLEQQGTQVKTVDGLFNMTIPDFIAYANQNPEQISPNVLLRPVYQETILPNIVYVGGPAETEYWLQLDELFKALNLTTPLRQLRICHTVITAKMAEKLEQSKLPLEILFDNDDKITKWVLGQSGTNEQAFDSERKKLEDLFVELAIKAKTVDPTLEGAVMAEKTRQEKALENTIGRIIKAEKTKHEVEINKYLKIKSTVLPGNSPQERIFTLLEVGNITLEQFFESVLRDELGVMNIRA